MKVFVTGGTGYVGSAIVVELLRRGHSITVLSRDPARSSLTGVEMVKGSMDDQDVIREAIAGHDACIHNAIVWDAEPTELELKDTRTSVALFRAAAEAGVGHMIYTSSTAVHSPFKPFMDEDAHLAPSDFYGATKAAAEVFLAAFSWQTQMRCNIVRPGPAIGPPVSDDIRMACSRRFREIVRSALDGQEISVCKGDGRQFVDVADLALVYADLLESDRNHDIYLAVSRDFMTWEDIGALACQITGSNSRIKAHRPTFSPLLFDTKRIEEDFGLVFSTKQRMERHLRRVVDDYSVK